MGLKILLLMILLHVIDDFHLQGILSNMKQREWWLKQNEYKELYKNDYRVALLIHSLSWAIFITIPLWFFCVSTYWLSGFILVNTAIHYYVDDLKCNKHKISLDTDQTIHFMQIYATWFICGLII